MIFIFRPCFFCRVAEEFHDRTYVTVANMTGGQPVLRLLCLDAAEKLAATYRTSIRRFSFPQRYHPSVIMPAC
ncbi:MAG: hypothetical protein ACOX1A_05035 [Saccharofermentanales bacterium]